MKRTIAISVLAIMGATMASQALAQESKPLGLSVRAGIFLPTNDKAKKSGGKQWISGGVEYKLGDLNYAAGNGQMSGSYSLSVDIYQKKDYRHMPVLLNYTSRMADGMYFNAGAGVGFVRELDNTNARKSSSAFSYQLGVGKDFSRGKTPFFVEAKWVGSSKKSVSGYGIFVGARF